MILLKVKEHGKCMSENKVMQGMQIKCWQMEKM
jgi:hypothetical protein